MKKIICMLAMALLAIGAAQAQNQVRKMVIQKTNGQVMKCKTAEIETVTFEEVAVPTTVEEAEAMLVGYWKWSMSPQELYAGYPDGFESFYFVVTEEHKTYWVLKIADSVTDESIAPYAGKYVVFGEEAGSISVNSEDPTTGNVLDDIFLFNNLDQNSFDAHVDDDGIKLDFTCSRVEPFEFIIDE